MPAGSAAGTAAADLGGGEAGRGRRRGGVLPREPGARAGGVPEGPPDPRGLGYFETEGNRSRRLATYAAMLAKVQALDRRPVTLHRTYLAGGAKAPVDGVKKLFSAGVRGAAIRLFEPETELALAEGIETALAVHLRLGLPVWAAGNGGALEARRNPRDRHGGEHLRRLRRELLRSGGRLCARASAGGRKAQAARRSVRPAGSRVRTSWTCTTGESALRRDV